MKIEDYLHFYIGCECMIKPILRPLSDMTEEEKKELRMPKDISKVIWFTPDNIRLMLSKGFDLFGLIDAGLAIDKTTLKQ